MKLIEILENRKEALKVAEVAKMLGVTPQHIYKMARKASFLVSTSREPSASAHPMSPLGFEKKSNNLAKGESR